MSPAVMVAVPVAMVVLVVVAFGCGLTAPAGDRKYLYRGNVTGLLDLAGLGQLG